MLLVVIAYLDIGTKLNLSRISLNYVVDYLKYRGLSRSVVSDECDLLALLYGARDVLATILKFYN